MPFENTLTAHLDVEKPLHFVLNEEIEDKIIGDMLLLDPEDIDEQLSKERSLSLFKIHADGGFYNIEIMKVRLFRLCIRFIARGSSVRLASRLEQEAKEETSLAYLVGTSEKKIREYVRAIVAICLQNILPMRYNLHGRTLWL